MDESDSEKEVKRLLLIFHLKEKDLQFEKDRNMDGIEQTDRPD